MSANFEKYVSDLGDLEDLIIGKKLGFGIHRDVYEFYFSDEKVLKVANCAEGRAQNILEYRIYEELENTKYQKYFAKCFGVSVNGKYLLQEKVTIKDIKKYPKIIPHFFTDTKCENYGWTNKGKFVCCDYSLTIITNGFTNKVKKANWY